MMNGFYVAAVAHLDSPRCFYAHAGTPPGPGAVLLEAVAGEYAVTYRYAASRAAVGEVWHPSVEAALADLAAEFPAGLGPWAPVPPGEFDPHAYAARYAAAAAAAGTQREG